MQIRIQALANLGQAEAQFAALQTQVDKLNASLARTAMVPTGGSVKGFTQAQGAARSASREFANALAASGAFRAEQVRLPSIINKTTEALKAQKLTFGQVFGKGARDSMRAVYKEQLALQKAFASQITGGVGTGRATMTMAVPTEVHKSWDTLSNRVGFFQARLKSASAQMVNWGKQMQWSGRQLMTGLTLPVAAFGAAAGVMAYQVNKQFTRIKKVYDTTANANSTLASEMAAYAKEIGDLQTAAFKTSADAAREYGVSITDTMSVQADLAATGQKGAALQAATTQVVRNATLGEIDYQTATSATIALQQQLHLSNQDLADSWAYMNSVENATSLGMKDFALAIPIALAPIRQMGGDLQDLGTLMTAMVSRGVQVGKAANAIKALPQRLSRPSKQVQEEFRALTGQDIVELNKKNPDNIIGLLTSIEDATKNLSTFDKRKALAGLFGSYQLSTMSAMLQGMDDLTQGIGQTSQAFDIGTQSAQTWQEVSDREITAFQQSASGKFKIAFQSIKAELATIGEPFLEVAANFLDFGTKIFKFFNGLPTIVKKGALLTIFLGAILGPIVMLAGLFVQLAGNVGKMFASVLNLAKGMKVLSIGEHAVALEAKMVEKGFISEQSEAELLTARLKALTDATMAQADAMTAMASASTAASRAMTAARGGVAGNRPLLPIVPPNHNSVTPLYGTPKPLPYKGPSVQEQIKSNYIAPPVMSNINSMQQAAKARAEAVAQEAAYLKTAEQIAAASGLTARNATASERADARITQEYLKQVKLAEEIMSMTGLGARNSSIAEFTEAKKTRLMIEQSKLAQEIMALTGLAARDASLEEKFRADQLRAELAITAEKTAQLALTERTAKMAVAPAGPGMQNVYGAAYRAGPDAAQAKIAEQTQRAMSGAAVAGAAMSASMLLMMTTSNETANNIGKWLLIATIGVPAMKAVGLAAAGVGANFAKAAIAARGTAIGATQASIATARTAGAARIMAGGFAGAKAAALGIMGPLGWALTAMTAIGYAFYKIHQSNQEQIKKQIADQKALADGAKNYADYLGTAAGNFDKIALATAGTSTAADPTAFDKGYKYYTDSKTGKDEVQGYKDLDSEAQKAAAAAEKFTELMAINKLTAAQATTQMSAFYAAAGDSITEASVNAQALANTIGDIKNLDYSKALDNVVNILPQFSGEMDSKQYEQMVSDNAIKYGQLWSAGFANALNPDAANQFIQKLTDQAYSGYSDMLDKLKSYDWGEDQKNVDEMLKQVQDRAAKYGESQVKALRGIMKDGDFNAIDIFGTEQGKGWYAAMDSASSYEKQIVKAVVTSQGLDENIDTLAELTGDAAITSKTLTYDEAVTAAQKLAKTWTDNNIALDGYKHTLESLPTDQKFAERSLKPFLSSLDNNTLGTIGLDDKSVQDSKTYSEDNLKRLDLTRDKLLGLVQLAMQQNNLSATAGINQENLVQGFKQGNTAMEALNYLLGKTPSEIADAASEAAHLVKNLRESGNIKFSITASQAQTAVKNSFTAVQSQMADMAKSQLDAQADADAASVDKYWDKRSEQLDNAQKAQTKRLEAEQQKAQDRFDAMQQKAQDHFDATQQKAQRKFDRRQENEQERFDKRWERRKNTVQNASDARIASIQKEIDAEQAADDARQAMFEAEQRRIERLAESANKGIDFNIALSTGDIDQAAKLQNDIAATAATNANADNQTRQDAASKAKIDALNRTKDAIQSETDTELAALQKAEDAASKSFQRRQEKAQRHFQRMQELEQRAFQKSQELEQRRFQKSQDLQNEALQKAQDRAKKALEQQTANAKAANAAEWQARKDSLDKQLALFTAFTVSSKAQLDKWMAKTGLAYSDFGIKSGDWFNKAFKQQLRVEGASLGSDSMWASLGADVAKQTIKGMGFGGLKGFAHFIQTGELPDNFGKAKPTTSYGDDHRTPPAQDNHGGGLIGDGGTGRKGVARTIKGIGPGERLVRARDTEFMVNETATKKHRGLLEAINSGRVNSSRNNVGDGVGGKNGNVTMGGFAAALAGRALAAGASMALNNAFASKMGSISGGSYSGLGGGAFGDEGNFDAEQIKNAAIIASVGAQLGMTSRDIQIGIMTAIAESSLRNLSSGDRDSVGLFQQRTSQGWGTVEQIMDPNYASTQFFNHLKGITDRANMAPWLAAQAVQRSAYSDGSNYHRWWDEAQAIFKSGLVKNENGYAANGLTGPGGKHLPSIPGKGWSTPHDYLNGENSPIFAFNDGIISKAQAITSGGTVGNGHFTAPNGLPYRSYGEVIEVTAHDGTRLLSAHMAPGTSSRWTVGQPVAGGTLLGKSSWTGNASGPHTHFEINGSGNGNARGLMQAYGIGLDGTTMRTGPSGGALEDAGVDPGGGWTYGELPGQAGYDPYTAMNEWLQAQAEARAAAAKAAARQDNKAARQAKQAEKQALIDAITNTQKQLDGENAYIQRLKNQPWPDKARINAAQADRNKTKKALEQAQAALEAWRAAQSNAPDDTATTTGAGNKVSTGTYNMLFSSPNSGTQQDLARLFKLTDILSMTEYSEAKHGLAPWINAQGWGIAGTGENVVAYNKSKYNASNTGSVTLNDTVGESLSGKNGAGGSGRAQAAYTMLKGQGGEKFWQVAAHTIAHIWKNPTLNRKVQQEQFGNLAALGTRLGKNGLPVFIGADLNNDPRNIEGSRPGGRQGMANFAPFTDAGFSTNWTKEAMNNNSGTMGDRFIDHVMFNSAAKLLSTRTIGGLNSDHNAVISEFNIPSHADGAQNIAWDNTLVNLHKGEGVLTEAQNAKFRNLANNIDQVATGGETNYNSKVEVTTNADANEIARKVVQNQKKEARRKAMRRTVSV